MNTLTNDHGNGNSTTYQLIEGNKPMPIAYNLGTSQQVINAIERARINRTRIRIYLGDIITGKCWNEENDIAGYVGLSKGNKAYYPILVNNSASFGGGSLMDNCIIKIIESKGTKVLYQSNNFIQPIVEIKDSVKIGFTHSVYIDGSLYSNHTSLKSAQLLQKKMQ